MSTRKIFIIKEFTKKIKIIFNNINKIFIAKTLLLTIKQKGLIKEYTAFFR